MQWWRHPQTRGSRGASHLCPRHLPYAGPPPAAMKLLAIIFLISGITKIGGKPAQHKVCATLRSCQSRVLLSRHASATCETKLLGGCYHRRCGSLFENLSEQPGRLIFIMAHSAAAGATACSSSLFVDAVDAAGILSCPSLLFVSLSPSAKATAAFSTERGCLLPLVTTALIHGSPFPPLRLSPAHPQIGGSMEWARATNERMLNETKRPVPFERRQITPNRATSMPAAHLTPFRASQHIAHAQSRIQPLVMIGVEICDGIYASRPTLRLSFRR